jgi:hypothetical protein
MAAFLMVVRDLDPECIAITPHKTYPPLIVNADAVLPFPIAYQGLETVPGWGGQIAQIRCCVQLPKLPECDSFDRPKTLHGFAIVKPLGILRAKGLDHVSSLYCYTLNVNQKATRCRGPFTAQVSHGLETHPLTRSNRMFHFTYSPP